MQIKTTVKTHTSEMCIIKKSTNNKCWRGCGKVETFLHCWWECKLVQPIWRMVWRFLKKLNIQLPYEPAIPLLGIFSEKTIIEKDTCTPIFIAALLATAETWKQPKCSLTDEWIKKMWYVHTHTHTHTHTQWNIIQPLKKECNNAFCSNTEGPRGCHSKWSKPDKDK